MLGWCWVGLWQYLLMNIADENMRDNEFNKPRRSCRTRYWEIQTSVWGGEISGEGDGGIEHAGVEDLLGIDHGGKDKMYKVDIGNNYLKYNVNVIVTDSSINGRDKDYTDECNEAKKRELGFSHLVNIRKRK